jgi:Carboxypeptidase regulatory-like domain/TonB-dependent Receptor Plug Domain
MTLFLRLVVFGLTALMFSVFSAGSVHAQAVGVLEGRVLDAQTQEPLPFVTVTLVEANKGAVTAEEGTFRIPDVPLGTYTVRASSGEYAPFLKYQVRMESGVTTLNIELRGVDSATTEDVEIRGDFFARGNTELVSTRSIGLEQIQSNPGGNQDISRALQSLPGVTNGGGFRNDLVIRGGGPNENTFFLDGIEVPNINHFATQGSGGGPQGLIPSYLIQSVKFQTSGFAAKYDNAMSSVLDFELQTANSERFQSLLTVSATELGAAFDTPVGKKIRLTSSIRRGYFDLLAPAIGLPFLPVYNDVATKLVWQINPRTSLTYLHIGAWDDFSRNVNDDADSLEVAILDALPKIEQRTFTQGVVFKRNTARGVYSMALSRNFLVNSYEAYEPLGTYTANQTEGEKVLDYESVETETKFRFWATTVRNKWEINYGAVVQFAEFSSDSRNILAIPVIEDDTSYAIRQTVVASSDLGFARYGAHIQVSRTYLDGRLRSSAGLRTDMNSFTVEGSDPLKTLSPRGALSLALSSKFFLNASTGVFYKLPPYVSLGYAPEGRYANRKSEYYRSTHFVFGGEFRPRTSTVFSLEGFLKLYDNYPVDLSSGLSLANLGANFDLYGNTSISSVGKGRAWGVELFAQQQLTKRLYGIFSYTFYKSEYTGIDTATGKQTDYIRSAWDFEHALTASGGYRFGQNNSWEVSARVRATGGQPYTPWDVERSIETYPLTGRAVLDDTRTNQLVTDLYTTLDIRLDKRWFFQKWSLNLFLDIQNATNNENLGAPSFYLARDANGNFIEDASGVRLLDNVQTNIIPSIGIRVKY